MNILEFVKIKLGAMYNKYLENGENEVHYIGGSQTLPPPLEGKEEEELLIRLRK